LAKYSSTLCGQDPHLVQRLRGCPTQHAMSCECDMNCWNAFCRVRRAKYERYRAISRFPAFNRVAGSIRGPPQPRMHFPACYLALYLF
jgi:hypothetical protein